MCSNKGGRILSDKPRSGRLGGVPLRCASQHSFTLRAIQGLRRLRPSWQSSVYSPTVVLQTHRTTNEVDMPQPVQLVHDSPISYATSIDFCKTFTEELHSLYLLSLLLTADNDKAEQCFIGAMGECGEGIGIFADWARSWARRAILKHAIQMIRPVPEHPDHLSFVSDEVPATSVANNPLAAVFALGAFERFVYVMSILEAHSERDCAILLRCSRRDVMIARVLALTRLANIDAAYAQANESS